MIYEDMQQSVSNQIAVYYSFDITYFLMDLMHNLLGRYYFTGFQEDNLTYLRGSSFVGGKSKIGTFAFVSLAHF